LQKTQQGQTVTIATDVFLTHGVLSAATWMAHSHAPLQGAPMVNTKFGC